MKKKVFLLVWFLVSCQQLHSTKESEREIDLRVVAIKDIEQVIHFLHPTLSSVNPRRYFSFSDDTFPHNTSHSEDSIIRESLRHNPDLVDQLIVNVTDLFLERSQSDSLAHTLASFIQKHPQSSFGYYLQASLKEKQKQVPAAIQQLDQAIKHNSRISQYYLKKARLLEESQDFSGALVVYDQVILLLDQKWQTYWRKAGLYGKLKQPESAIESFTKAILLLEEYAEKQKKRPSHEEDFSLYVEGDPGGIGQQIADAYTLRGSYFAQNGLTSKACLDWKKASQLGDVSAVELLKEFCK